MLEYAGVQAPTRLNAKLRQEVVATLTVTWYPRERDVHAYVQLFPATLVHQNRRVNIDSSVVEELNGGERKDDGGRDDCHCFNLADSARCTVNTRRTERASTRLDFDIFGCLACGSRSLCNLDNGVNKPCRRRRCL